MMNNWVVLPLLIPLCTGIILIFFSSIRSQRLISGISAFLNIAATAYLVHMVRSEGIQTLHMSGWKPPFGIVFVADMLSSLLVLTSAVIVAACLFYAFRSIGEAREKTYFYSLSQFMTAGVMGAFLTGDIFNLFVCFEVMLISSYGLITLGGEKRQLRESIKYILINIVSSSLFVAAVAYLYSITGALNMADLAVKLNGMGADGLVTVIGVLFLIVFSLKAGLVLFFWLPGSYSAPPAAIIALFSGLLTKVGVYAILRTFTLIFVQEPEVTHSIIAGMAAVTMVLGSLGALAYQDVNRILIYNIIISVGFVCFGLAADHPAAMNGVVFYLVHDMIAKALIFLLGGALIAMAGTEQVQRMGGLIKRAPLLGWMFFITALAIAGVPPLSGFIGKLLILQGGLSSGYYWLSGLAVTSSLIVLYSLMRLFMGAFWGKWQEAADNKLDHKMESSSSPSDLRLPKGLLLPAGALLAVVMLLGLGAEWFVPYAAQAGEVLLNPQVYIEAVFGG